MKERSKRYKESKKQADLTKAYQLKESILLLKKMVPTKFDGSIDLHFASAEIDEATKLYYSALADRLVVGLENARKNEEIQLRASNEHLVRDLTTKVQSYTSIDDILRTAASELGRSLGLSEVEVGLIPQPEKPSEG